MPLPSSSFDPSLALSPFLEDLPASTPDDVLAVFPGWFRDSVSAVRDALASTLVDAYARLASNLADYAAQGDPAHATGAALDLHGKGRGCPRALNELDDPSYRARVLGDPGLITPAAMVGAINAILAPFTSKKAYYWEEPLDGIFSRSVPLNAFNVPAPDASNPAHVAGFYSRSWDTTIPNIFQVQNAFRSYAARSAVVDCQPRHGLMFDTYSNDADPTRVFNQHNRAIIGIPAITSPGTQIGSGFAHSMVVASQTNALPLTPLIDAGGNLTPAAADFDAASASSFSMATLGGPWPDGTVITGAVAQVGIAAWSSDHDPQTLLSQIFALLTTSAMWPVNFVVFLDPTL